MITRRAWLKGLAAGSVMVSPLARSLAAQAAGATQPPPPKRFVFVLHGRAAAFEGQAMWPWISMVRTRLFPARRA